MMPRTRLLLAAALLAVLGLAAPGAGAGKGYLALQPLRVVTGSGEPDARGAFGAWLRVRNDKSIVQGIRVWFHGLSDAEGATLWMASPGEYEAEEIGSFAVAENGSGFWEVVVDSRLDDGAELPLGAESVLRLLNALIEVRLPGADLADAPVLKARIGDFHFRDLAIHPPVPAGRVATTVLRLPPPPTAVADEAATGRLLAWRRLPRKSEPAAQGVALFARGLTEDETYDVLVEDPSGTMVEVGSFDTTAEGIGWFSIDSRSGETLPAALGADDVRDLARRRVEIRRSGYDDPSLVALVPRVR